MHMTIILLALLATLGVLSYFARAMRPLPRAARRFRGESGLTCLAALGASSAGALLPSATTTIVEQSGGVATGTDICCVLSCMSQGTDLSSGGTIQLFSDANVLKSTYGFGEGLEFVAHYMQVTQKPVLFGALHAATVGALSCTDTSGVLGSSAITFTGTPIDDAAIQVLVTAPATVGTAGGMFQYSLDGGRNFSGSYRLGTATSFVIPNTGVTVNFGAGTLLLNDIAKVRATAPKWDTTALQNAFTALQNNGQFIPRLVVICGDISSSTSLQAVQTQIAAYEATNRFTCVVCSLRDYLPPAVYQGSDLITAQLTGQTVTTAATGETYTRSAGSWLTDGFQVGDEVVFAGFTNSGNNGKQVITTLTATVMTCSASTLVNEGPVSSVTCTTLGGGAGVTVAAAGATYTRTVGSWITDGFQVGQTVTFGGFTNSGNNGSAHGTVTTVTATVLTMSSTTGLVNEGPTYGITATAIETDTSWQTALDAVVGATPLTELVQSRVMATGGRARRISPVDGFQRRRPAAWPISIRWMLKDVKTSPGRVSDQGLEGWTITQANGTPEDHDERTQGGLLALRVACLRSYSEIGINGVYCALPVTLDNDGAPLSLLNFAGVACLAANIIQAMTTLCLQSTYDLNPDGTLAPYEQARFNSKIVSELKRQLLTKSLGGLDPGPRASSVSFAVSGVTNISVIGTPLPTQAQVQMQGIVLQIRNSVVVGNPTTQPAP